MGKIAVLTTIVLFLIVADVASATFLWNFRKLVSSEATKSSNAAVSPNPSQAPISGDDTSKNKFVPKTPPPETARHSKKGGEEEDEGKASEPSGSNKTCNMAEHYCRDTLSMFACVLAVDEVNLIVLIQNDGGNNLKVDIRNSSWEKLKEIEVPKHGAEKITISLNVVGTQILLNAGSGDCILQIGLPTTIYDFSKWIPSYTKLMTPIYGAYFLLLATVVALAVFACCKCRKRRQDEIPYQELEMCEVPETTSIDVETAEGWDQGWGDDWDDNEAAKSPEARHPGSISANGLTARSSSRDGWEDWDD